jgi:hypothetical protein
MRGVIFFSCVGLGEIAFLLFFVFAMTALLRVGPWSSQGYFWRRKQQWLRPSLDLSHCLFPVEGGMSLYGCFISIPILFRRQARKIICSCGHLTLNSTPPRLLAAEFGFRFKPEIPFLRQFFRQNIFAGFLAEFQAVTVGTVEMAVVSPAKPENGRPEMNAANAAFCLIIVVAVVFVFINRRR